MILAQEEAPAAEPEAQAPNGVAEKGEGKAAEVCEEDCCMLPVMDNQWLVWVCMSECVTGC